MGQVPTYQQANGPTGLHRQLGRVVCRMSTGKRFELAFFDQFQMIIVKQGIFTVP